jgi:hypothetical protein
MPAAIAVPAIIGAAGVGASLYGASKASGASQEAARIQSQAANQAQAFNREVYQNQRQITNPYVQAGTESLARLMAQHWGTPYQAPQGPQGSPPMQTQPGPMMPPNGPPQGSLGAMQQQGPRLVGSGQSLGAMQQGPQGGMVQMQAPDGSVQAVPQHVVAQLEQRGARRVGG